VIWVWLWFSKISCDFCHLSGLWLFSLSALRRI
jgi:hypothetical protein